MANLDDLLSAPQAAELLGISVKTLYRNSYVYDDFPQPTKVGRTVLYDPDELRAWRYEHPPRERTITR
ncbi:putative DNA-binding transcriptional regulator AlpA [Actinopolyspora lacussalsi]|nr:putative DNA-binding transcriptional regulator AlpA [Actinopolyspora lacussalsi]